MKSQRNKLVVNVKIDYDVEGGLTLKALEWVKEEVRALCGKHYSAKEFDESDDFLVLQRSVTVKAEMQE